MTNNMIFLLQPADDDSVDAEYELRKPDYSETGITIQDGRAYGGRWSVNEHGGEGDDFWVRHIREFRSLKEAKAFALAYYSQAKKAA
jgi:hypothetical protein